MALFETLTDAENLEKLLFTQTLAEMTNDVLACTSTMGDQGTIAEADWNKVLENLKRIASGKPMSSIR